MAAGRVAGAWVQKVWLPLQASVQVALPALARQAAYWAAWSS